MSIFRFKHFHLHQENAVLKVGTDALVLSALIPIKEAKQILDIGSGTGVIGLLMGQENPNAQIDFVEVQSEYTADFQRTIQQPLFQNRCFLHPLSIQEFQTTKSYDLIVSNPPYYTDALLGQNVFLNKAKHVQELTLELLLFHVSRLISEEGQFFFIWPSEKESEIHEVIHQSGLFLNTQIQVYGKPGRLKRFVFGLSKQNTATTHHSFLIRNEDNSYSEQYKEATRSFHGVNL